MADASKPREVDRRAQDRGRSGESRRWFSSRTIDASDHYRDWSWAKTVAHLTGAVGLTVLSRIDPGWALAPWMLIAGVAWTVWGLRAAVLKFIGQHV